MRRLVRVGPVVPSEARTIDRSDNGTTEILESVQVRVSAWKTVGVAQRWVAVRLVGGSHEGLEVFIPLDVFERHGAEVVPGIDAGPVIVE